MTNIQHFQNNNYNFNSIMPNQNIENKFASHSAQSLLYQPSSANNNNNNQQFSAYPSNDFKSNTFINMDNILKNNNIISRYSRN